MLLKKLADLVVPPITRFWSGKGGRTKCQNYWRFILTTIQSFEIQKNGVDILAFDTFTN